MLTGAQLGIALALVSAVATAFAHAYLKVGQDKLAVQAWIRLIGLAAFLPLAIHFGTPPAALMPWIVSAALIHATYQWALIHSYRLSDFSIAYPLARGTAPLFTLLFGVIVLRDQPAVEVMAGVAMLCAGILTLVRHGSISRRGALVAAATGLLTTPIRSSMPRACARRRVPCTSSHGSTSPMASPCLHCWPCEMAGDSSRPCAANRRSASRRVCLHSLLLSLHCSPFAWPRSVRLPPFARRAC